LRVCVYDRTDWSLGEDDESMTPIYAVLIIVFLVPIVVLVHRANRQLAEHSGY